MSKRDTFRVFIVDDDTKLLTMMKHYIETNSMFNVEMHTFATGEDCLNKIDMKPDIVILDYYFDDLDQNAKTGLHIQKEILKKSSETKIIMISGQDDMEIALETIRNGSYDYIIKDDKAIMRTHLTLDNILQAKTKTLELESNNKNLKTTIILMVVFIIAMIAFVIYATIK